MPWTIYARQPDLKRYGELDYVSATLIPRFNAVGSWELTMDGRDPMATVLTQPGWGIEAVNENRVTVLSGPVDQPKRDVSENTNRITLNGSDDLVFLAERLAHPQPASTAPPYNSTDYDVRTSVCSTVLRAYVDANAGPGAIAPRRVPNLTIGTDPVVGSSVTGRARWANLLEFLQGLAVTGGGVAFRIQKVGTGLQFQTYMPVDRSGAVQFSILKGNLGSYSYSFKKPEMTYCYVGGGGEGTARTIQEGQDSAGVAQWRRIEKFVDRRDTTDSDVLAQEITKQLKDGGSEVQVSIVPVDLPGSAYLTDYNLGDKVSAVVDDTVVDVIREVKITLSADKAPRIVPAIGTPSYSDVVRMFSRIKQLGRRVTNLERR